MVRCRNNVHGVRSGGFTLIELLVVIAIIALLVSILLPSLNKAKDLAKSAVCMGNMHHIGLAIPMYVNDYNGWLPPYTDPSPQSDGKSATFDGVTYTTTRRYALVRDWFKSGAYRDYPRDGDGFYRPYMGTTKTGVGNIMGCPSVPLDRPTVVGTWAGGEYSQQISYEYSYGLNFWYTTQAVIQKREVYDPIRFGQIKKPSGLVYIADAQSGCPYVMAGAYDNWQDYTLGVPVPRHLDKFNCVFTDSHVESGTMDKLYTKEFFEWDPDK